MSESQHTMQILAVRQPSLKRADGRLTSLAFMPKSVDEAPAFLECELPAGTVEQALGTFAVTQIQDLGYKIMGDYVTDVFNSTIEPSRTFAVVRSVKRPHSAAETLQEVSLYRALNRVLNLDAPGVFPEVSIALARASYNDWPKPALGVGRRAMYDWVLTGNSTCEQEIVTAFEPWLRRSFSGKVSV